MRVVALILSLMMVPFKASADSIFLMCRYNENIKTVNAQGKLIQDDWHEYTTTIDLRNEIL